MQRDPGPRSPTITPLTGSLERTARWVEDQAAAAYNTAASPPPSPSTTSSSSAMNRLHSNRTTASSDQSVPMPMAKHRGVPPSPTHTHPLPGPSPSRYSHNHNHSHNMTYNPPSGDTSRLRPFPQSPPGSGYPMALDVAPPKSPSEPDGTQRKAMRPSTAKKRRPSLLNHFKWKRDDEGGKAG